MKTRFTILLGLIVTAPRSSARPGFALRRCITGIAILGLHAAAASTFAQDAKDVEHFNQRAAEFRAARIAYSGTFFRGDTRTMAQLEAGEFTAFHDRAAELQSQKEWQEDIRRRVAAKTWAPKRVAEEMVSQSVRIADHVATVHGAGEIRPGAANGRRMHKTFSEVWAFRDGQWRIVHLHYDYRALQNEVNP